MVIKDSNFESNIKFCATCGAQIHEKAEICPKCGIRCLDMENSLVQNSSNKSNKSVILAVFGVISGVLAGILLFVLSPLMDIVANNSDSMLISSFAGSLAVVCVLASVFGLIGIFLEGHDKKVAAFQYIVCGFFVLICGVFIIGLIPSIFFFVAGLLAYQDSKRVVDKNE